uniref:Uncharacterized protein n=1 Tax=Anguilla anguilla TaxID=7936 RepID=A0A0E9W6M1_ANGAN
MIVHSLFLVQWLIHFTQKLKWLFNLQ